MFFSDDVRRIDYILAYEPDKTSSQENRRIKREYFEKELQSEGLQLEYEPIEVSLFILAQGHSYKKCRRSRLGLRCNRSSGFFLGVSFTSEP